MIHWFGGEMTHFPADHLASLFCNLSQESAVRMYIACTGSST